MTQSERLRRFLGDRTAGAAELAEEALAIIENEAVHGISARALDRLRRRLAAAHPAMGAVWNAVHAGDARAFRHHRTRSLREAVRALRRHLRRRARVVTLSYSSSVVAALARRDLTVVVAHSLPGGEGMITVERLTARGVTACLVADGLVAHVLAQADACVVGADAITPTAIVNKAGTLSLVLAARYRRVPRYVVADQSKHVPPGWPVPHCSEETPFEEIPRRLFTGVFSGER